MARCVSPGYHAGMSHVPPNPDPDAGKPATGAAMTLGGRLYITWAVTAIGLSMLAGGFKVENITRLLVILFLVILYLGGPRVLRLLRLRPTKSSFVLTGTALACVVEAFHMISKPVFGSLQVTSDTGLPQAVRFLLIDLAFTVPAYLVIFSVVWWLLNRWRYSFWEYTIIMGIGQTLGDGGIFYFAAAPHMVLFLPYPATNYHACNVIPYIAVAGADQGTPVSLWRKLLAIPILVVTYLACAIPIKLLGRMLGFA